MHRVLKQESNLQKRALSTSNVAVAADKKARFEPVSANVCVRSPCSDCDCERIAESIDDSSVAESDTDSEVSSDGCDSDQPEEQDRDSDRSCDDKNDSFLSDSDEAVIILIKDQKDMCANMFKVADGIRTGTMMVKKSSSYTKDDVLKRLDAGKLKLNSKNFRVSGKTHQVQ